MRSEHLQAVLSKKDSVYAIPIGSGPVEEFLVFKPVSLHPHRRSYLQRAFALSTDDSWHDDNGVGLGLRLSLGHES